MIDLLGLGGSTSNLTSNLRMMTDVGVAFP
jgi:hypothetical protein